MSSHEYTFRRCKPNDAALLRSVAVACYTPYYRDLWEPGGMDTYLKSIYEPVLLMSELADPELRFEMVYDDSGPVGFSKYHHHCDRAGTPNAAYIERVYVAPSVAGRGVGSLLIDRMIATARTDRRDWIWLQAMAHATKPIERYRALGFEECGHHSLSLPNVRRSEAAMVVMRMPLADR